ncbi:abortive infection system antitoxin AbiGi family protein [Paenibacillus jamilae]|uniref:Abortive infection system antitoxin AbiGi family protein n=1 Tax=Paenibacillus alvei TaxID=44250 RepID=A0ABT4E8G2_PAEAL|nr:abortive infection system antitoxin AbiGi family protein [Paenibacillus alvei]MCY9530032.1 abortive infection system antitoxin AbiGi family protein [Paenibacillus alvei]
MDALVKTNPENPEMQELDEPINPHPVYIIPKQSANVLFNFMKKLDYLKMIIHNKALIPRYNLEDISYLKLKDYKGIALPMKCFCDIHLNKLVYHMENYGNYGIGLHKEWGIQNGIQPINYVNPESNLIKDFVHVFNSALELDDSDESIRFDKYNNFLLMNLLFMKPLNGYMLIDSDNKYMNFHDEREWRYIPDLRQFSELPLILPQEHLNPDTMNMYSNGLTRTESSWLKLDFKHIKYLVVDSEADREDLISFIMNENTTSELESLTLCSKILVFNQLKEDW